MVHQREGGRLGKPSEEASKFDPTEFVERIRHEWDAVAEDWGRDEWHSIVEAAAAPVSERLIAMAGVGEGHRVLDLGSGVGEPAARAADHVGPTGRVLGLDLSPRMVEIGNRRLQRLGLSDRVELRVGDAGRPQVDEASFDSALSRWVLMLVPDLTSALGRIRRALVPGGRLAVALWGHPTRVPMINAALRLAEVMMPEPPLPPDAPTHLWHTGARGFAALMEEAGYRDVATDRVAIAFHFDSAEKYSEFIIAMAGPLRVVADSLPAAERGRMMGALAEVATDFADREGHVHLVNEVLCIAGSRTS